MDTLRKKAILQLLPSFISVVLFGAFIFIILLVAGHSEVISAIIGLLCIINGFMALAINELMEFSRALYKYSKTMTSAYNNHLDFYHKHDIFDKNEPNVHYKH